MRSHFIEAVDAGDFRSVERLIKAGADVNSRDGDGITALMYAAWQGHDQVIKVLLSHAADPNIQDDFGWTALMHAARYNQMDVLPLLLDAKTDVTLKNKHGETAFEIAFFNFNGAFANALSKHMEKSSPSDFLPKSPSSKKGAPPSP